MAKISLHKTGKYYTRISINGKQKSIYGNTKKEVKEKLLNLELQIRQGINISSGQYTFLEWAEFWEKSKKTTIRAQTFSSLQYPLKHLIAVFGAHDIKKIKHLDIQQLLYDLAEHNPTTGEPSATNTLQKILNCANGIFSLALQNQAIQFNPCINVIIPKSKPVKKRRALTIEEQRWILETEHKAQLPAMIMLFAGLRLSELLAMTWNDIDFENKAITVNKSIAYINGQPQLQNQTKTEAGMRTIYPSPILFDFLKKQNRSTIYITTSAKGNIHTKSSWRHLWNTYLALLNDKYGELPFVKLNTKNKPFGIERFTAHYLRHTFVSNVVMSGVDISSAKKQIGHCDSKVLLDIYTHISEKHQQDEMTKLDEYINRLLG